MNVWKRRKKAF